MVEDEVKAVAVVLEMEEANMACNFLQLVVVMHRDGDGVIGLDADAVKREGAVRLVAAA